MRLSKQTEDGFGFTQAKPQSRVLVNLQTRNKLPTSLLELNSVRKQTKRLSRLSPTRLMKNPVQQVINLMEEQDQNEEDRRFEKLQSEMTRLSNSLKFSFTDRLSHTIHQPIHQKLVRLLKHPINSVELDPLLKDLAFFSKYPLFVRSSLYFYCQPIFLKNGQTIYRRGDSSKHIFVVFRGLVELIDERMVSNARATVYLNQPTEIWGRFISNTISDGYHFGEGQQKRDLTAQTAQTCILIRIQQKAYKEVLQTHVQDQITQKLRVVSLLPYFRQNDILAVSQFASILRTVTFAYGEVVIKAGQQLQELMILKEGKCQVILETCVRVAKSKESSERRVQLSEKKFDMTLLRVQEDAQVYSKHLVFKELQKGSVIGMRAILSGDAIKRKQQLFPKLDLIDEKARLSVIASSCSVTFLTANKLKVMSLPESILSSLNEGMILEAQFDDENKQGRLNQYQQWQKFKRQTLKQYAS